MAHTAWVVASGYDPGDKPAPLKNALRAILRQLKDGPVVMNSTIRPLLMSHSRPALRWRHRPNKATASHAAAHSAILALPMAANAREPRQRDTGGHRQCANARCAGLILQ